MITGLEYVEVIEEFLDVDDLFEIKKLSSDIYYGPEHCKRTNASWSKAVVGNSFPVICCQIEDENLLEVLQKKINANFNGYKIKTASFFYWTEFSYIPWHDDAGHDAAMTIYLSEHHMNDGGYFMHKKMVHTENGPQEEIVAIPPKINRAIFQAQGVQHATTAVNAKSPLRKTIQIFLDKA